MKLQLKKGVTSKLVQIFVNDSSVTTGAGLTGLAFDTGSLTAYYYREGAASPVVISLVDMTVGTWASGGFKAVDGTNLPGVYQLGLPDAALASGASSVVVMLKGASNMAPVLLEIQLVAFDPEDAVRLGLTALPNAGAGANGGVPLVDASGGVKIQSGTGAGQLDVTAGVVEANASISGTVDANLVSIDGQTTDGNNATLNLKKLNVINSAGDAIVAQGGGTGAHGLKLNGGTGGNGLYASGSGSSAGASFGGGTVDILCAATGRIAAELTGPVNGIGTDGRADVQTALTSQGLTTARAGYLDVLNGLIASIWNALTSGMVTAGSVGAAIVAIKAKTDSLTFTVPLKVDSTATINPDDVWDAPVRTLTQAAAQVVSGLDGSTITVLRGDLLTVALTGLGSLAGRTKLWFTMKRNVSQTDAQAVIQIVEGVGLVVLNGAAVPPEDPMSGDPEATWAEVVVDDEDAGDVTVTIQGMASALLAPVTDYAYDIQILDADDKPLTKVTGLFNVVGDVTRSIE